MREVEKIISSLGPDSVNQWAVTAWQSSLSDIELPLEVNPKKVASECKFCSAKSSKKSKFGSLGYRKTFFALLSKSFQSVNRVKRQ